MDWKSTPPPWKDPCGLGEYSGSAVPGHESLYKLLEQIRINTNRALTHAKMFMGEFARKTFPTARSYEDFVQIWGEYEFPWLPPKEKSDIGHGSYVRFLRPTRRDVNKFLVESYRHLQTFYVGLEQVHWDMKKGAGEFERDFRVAQDNLRAILCEIRDAIPGPVEDVERSVMPADIREAKGNTEMRNFRDLKILENYIFYLKSISATCDRFIAAIEERSFVHL